MKNFYPSLLKISLTLLAIFLLQQVWACTPLGDQTTYGTNNVWIGYVYTGKTFNTYSGYVTEGISTNPNFDESFGGDNVTYNTNGCPITTEGFSVRYKLSQSFTNANYSITVGGDDGYRLSLDGGSTWIINNWNDHSYTTTTITIALNGTTNLVLEYYENGGANRVSFNIAQICTGTEDQSVYGTSNVWKGYIYQGMNFDLYKGMVTEGAAGNAAFDENFGNTSNSNSATYNTSTCSITTYQFSARYRLTKTFASGSNYTLTVGGDDGYRLSLDGGSTWAINKWYDQGYSTSSYTAALNGTYNMVLEYYDNGGADRVSFSMSTVILPVKLISWSVSAAAADQQLLQWKTTDAVNFDHFIVQRSTDGEIFEDVHTVQAVAANGTAQQDYAYTDQYSYDGSVYYRLEMVDRDGSASYSNIMSLILHQEKSIRIYPTMVENGTLYVESTQSLAGVKLELFNMSGCRISEQDWASLSGRQQATLHSGSLPAGAYIARLSDSHSVLAKQIIIIK